MNVASLTAAAPAADGTLRAALGRVFDLAIGLYLSGKHGARGCFLIGTAAVEAVQSPQVRAVLAAQLAEIDDVFEARIAHGRADERRPVAAGP